MRGETGDDTSALDLAHRVLLKSTYEFHAIQCELASLGESTEHPTHDKGEV